MKTSINFKTTILPHLIALVLSCFAALPVAQAAPSPSNVVVVNSASNPVPVTVVNPQAAQPFQDTCSLNNSGACTFSPPPAGMRMVIQEFDFSATLNVAQFVFTILTTTLNNTGIDHFFPSNQTNSQSTGTFLAHHPTTLYHDDSSAGPSVRMSFSVSIQAGYCSISGYLVPKQ